MSRAKKKNSEPIQEEVLETNEEVVKEETSKEEVKDNGTVVAY